jgi:hypothetical protein
MTEKRYCKQCGKELVRKKYKRKSIKRGWEWESPKHFLARNFCNRSCKTLHQLLWTKEIILKRFNNIKTENKWNCKYMGKKYPAFMGAVQRCYKKNYWNKFVIEQGKTPMRNNLNPRYRVNARLLLKYFREEEVDNGIGKVFEYSVGYGIPGINQNFGDVSKAIKHLIKLRAIRIFKKGHSGSRNDNFPTQYVLLKSRI